MYKGTLIFDMDGTLNLFYDVDGWLNDLENENPRPYIIAKPKIDIDSFNILIGLLKDLGWKIAITSWLAKNSTEKYDKIVTQAKIEWLTKYNIQADEIHIVKYGVPKKNCTINNGGIQILFDDNAEVRKTFENKTENRYTIDANENILKALTEILEKELF